MTPVLVLGNKIDSKLSKSEDELTKALELQDKVMSDKTIDDNHNQMKWGNRRRRKSLDNSKRLIGLFMCSAVRRVGYEEGNSILLFSCLYVVIMLLLMLFVGFQWLSQYI